jgi:Skp family chaperone for outer membrane proteins
VKRNVLFLLLFAGLWLGSLSASERVDRIKTLSNQLRMQLNNLEKLTTASQQELLALREQLVKAQKEASSIRILWGEALKRSTELEQALQAYRRDLEIARQSLTRLTESLNSFHQPRTDWRFTLWIALAGAVGWGLFFFSAQ